MAAEHVCITVRFHYVLIAINDFVNR